MRLIILLAAIMFSQSVMAQQPVKTDDPKSDREIRREEREKQREQKKLEFQRYIDSLVMSHEFTFIPSDFAMQPAGSIHQISNPTFRIVIHANYVVICVPYFKGVSLQYVTTILDYTVPNPSKYVFERTKHGWDFSFESNLFSSSTYKFKFSIYNTSGETTLDIKSDLSNPVRYTGTLVAN